MTFLAKTLRQLLDLKKSLRVFLHVICMLNADIYLSLKHIICSVNVVERLSTAVSFMFMLCASFTSSL